MMNIKYYWLLVILFMGISCDTKDIKNPFLIDILYSLEQSLNIELNEIDNYPYKLNNVVIDFSQIREVMKNKKLFDQKTIFLLNQISLQKAYSINLSKNYKVRDIKSVHTIVYFVELIKQTNIEISLKITRNIDGKNITPCQYDYMKNNQGKFVLLSKECYKNPF